MCTHATSCIGETGLKIFNGFLIFFNSFPIFLNGFPIFLNSFLLVSKKSEKIYLRQEVYKRSLFEICIFCHSLSHSRSELRNTHYNTQHIHLEWIATLINIAKHLTKPLSRVLFHRHADFLLAPLKYSPIYQQTITTCGDHFTEDRDWFIPNSFTTPMTARAARIHAPTHDDIKGSPWLIVIWHE
jgi:hypothetical protein